MFKDYYAILEILPSVTKEEIKSAYRKQAIKWHPDKNPGSDTTQRMQDINEAYLILNDDEARSRYDREYLRFRSFQQATKEETTKQTQYEKKQEEEETTTEQKSSEKRTEKPKEEYSTYQFDDEVLKKWMENARKQAIRNVKEMISEFRTSSIIGFGVFFKTALQSIVVAIIFFILFMIIMSIKN